MMTTVMSTPAAAQHIHLRDLFWYVLAWTNSLTAVSTDNLDFPTYTALQTVCV